MIKSITINLQVSLVHIGVENAVGQLAISIHEDRTRKGSEYVDSKRER